MSEVLHLIGICPDSAQHISFVKGILANPQEIQWLYTYIRYLLK